MTDRTQTDGMWGQLDVSAGERRTLAFGTLRLVVERSAAEVRVQVSRAPRAGGAERADWERWVVPPESRLLLRPAVPDRLVVVSHGHPFHLPPSGEARVYVRIPLFVQLLLTGPSLGEHVMLDEPSIVLSDTWWGTHAEGELGYWLTTSARAEVTDDLFLTHTAMCPFQLDNRGRTALPVERFAVQVPHLSVFAEGGRNWTDEVRVRYEDSAEGSEIRFGREAPREAPEAGRVARPRVVAPKGLHVRTFQRLRSLSSLGS